VTGPGKAAARPKTLAGSPEAKRLASAVLEVLAGLRSPPDASAALGTSLQRYYLLETRALQGLIAALEPRPRGPRRRPEDKVAALTRERDRLARELLRSQALVRAAQRSVGIAPPKVERPGADKKGKRKRRPTVRAAKAIEALRQEAPAAPPPSSPAAAGPGPVAAEARGERDRRPLPLREAR
jgi:hypothetical protein